MFVLASTHQKALSQLADANLKLLTASIEYNVVRDQYLKLLDKWNDLVEKINQKGGMNFLDEGVLPKEAEIQITQEHITTLLQLCHPDKHDGKESATRMTQLLLSLRK